MGLRSKIRGHAGAKDLWGKKVWMDTNVICGQQKAFDCSALAWRKNVIGVGLRRQAVPTFIRATNGRSERGFGRRNVPGKIGAQRMRAADGRTA
jgi:hypothetical protein